MQKNRAVINKDPVLYALLANAHWKLNEYESAALAWDRAFKLNRENGIYAVNAANAMEMLDKKEEAFKRFLEAGRIFLRQDNHGELAALVPKLILLGPENWEARALAGKWAFSIEDYDRAETEFALAENLRRKLKPRPDADPAVSYLRGLIFSIKDKYREAARYFEEAVNLAPNYGLFRLKLAETRVLLSGNAYDPELAGVLQKAMKLLGNDPEGRMAHNAGLMLFRTGDLENADIFFRNALSISSDNLEFISSRLSCLLDLGEYTEAEEMLTHARLRKPSAELMELFQQLYSGRRCMPPPRKIPPKPLMQAKAAAGKTGVKKSVKAAGEKPSEKKPAKMAADKNSEPNQTQVAAIRTSSAKAVKTTNHKNLK